MEENCGPLTFFSNFDSGNLSKVELVESGVENIKGKDNSSLTNIECDYEYNVWTCPDCMGTPFENGNRTWFYFGIRGGSGGKTIKINVMNMNKQGKLYSQGMAPVVKVVPSKEPKWERVRNRVSHKVVDGQFILTFTYIFPEIKNVCVYFAFSYPFTYKECQKKLAQLDSEYLQESQPPKNHKSDRDVYYHRELLCNSIDQLRVDLVTVSSYIGIQDVKEEMIPGLFPDADGCRANKFEGKKVVFISARVHPGETPSSFVFNGFIDFILRRNDPRAALLRDKFVFKLIPMLNPDGVFRGYYRTDTRGVNLNRVYLNPDQSLHPSIFAVKCLINYYHSTGSVIGLGEVDHHVRNENDLNKIDYTLLLQPDNFNNNVIGNLENLGLSNKEPANGNSSLNNTESIIDPKVQETVDIKSVTEHIDISIPRESKSLFTNQAVMENFSCKEQPRDHSGLALYVDLHGHASKRGCFIYANNFENEDDQVNCLLFPKLISINSPNFDFNACNFSLKNMLSKDKRDGMSKEGSGRVAILKSTGILHSYTLECNYNTGRVINTVPLAFSDNGRSTPPMQAGYPPKYTPEIYAEVGRAMAISILDLCEINPWSRILSSEFHTIRNIKAWLLTYVQQTKEMLSSKKTNCSMPSKNSRTNTTLIPMIRTRGTSEMVYTKQGTTPRTTASRILLRKTSKCKSELNKSCQMISDADEEAISTEDRVTKLQAKSVGCHEHKSNENGEACKKAESNSTECLSQTRHIKKPHFHASGTKTRSQISKVTLSLDSSKRLRSKKAISQEVEKRVLAYRKKSTNDMLQTSKKKLLPSAMGKVQER